MSSRPLDGIRVAELSIAIAASTCGKYLANFGAEVIKIESRVSLDILRRMGSSWFDLTEHPVEVWNDTSPAIAETMAGKKSVGVDLKAAGGANAMRRLLTQCDVLLTNYSAEAVSRLGLDYATVSTIRPDIVYCALPGFGLDDRAPYHRFLAWGPNQAPLAGLDDLTGWPDRPPSGISTTSYPDYSSALHATIAILAALEHRDTVGEGQRIDLSQFEATVGLLGPHLLDYETSGTVCTRQGNRLPWLAPQGVYPCRGTDRWVAITVASNGEWRRLCKAIGQPELSDDARFATVVDRLEHHDALDALIGAWTSTYTATEVAVRLQSVGVAAAPVVDTPGLALDAHLQARDFWAIAPSRRFGTDLSTGVPIHLRGSPGHLDRSGPCLGEDNEEVLHELCGLSDQEIDDLVEGAAAFPMVNPDTRFERPYRAWIRNLMPDLSWNTYE